MRRKKVYYTRLNLKKIEVKFFLIMIFFIIGCIVLIGFRTWEDYGLKIIVYSITTFFSSFLMRDLILKYISLWYKNKIMKKYNISIGLIAQSSSYSYSLKGSSYYDVFIYGKNEYNISFEYYALGEIVFVDQDKVASFCYENKLKELDFKNMIQEISDYIILSKKIYAN